MKKRLLPFLALSLTLAFSAFAAPQPSLLNRGGARASRQTALERRNARNANGNGNTAANAAAANANAVPAANAAPASGGAPAVAADDADDADARGPHALNWEGAPRDLILEAYCDEVGKIPLVDPNCPKVDGITLKSPKGQKLSREDYLEAIETVLEMNGIHLEPYKDNFIRALPRKDVRKEGIPILMDPETKLGESGRVVSMMIPFENMTAEDAQKVLEGFKSNMGLLIVFERTNKILVTDTEQNINRMLEIARAIDIASPATEQAFVRQIKNASVEEIKTVLEKIVEDSQKWQEKNKAPANAQQPGAQPWRPGQQGLAGRGGGLLRGRNAPQPQPAAAPANNQSLVMSVSDADRGVIRGRVTIVSDERSNKLVVITSKSNMDFFDKVIESLDVETTPDTVVKVYRLKYAEAEDVSDMINDLIGNSSSSKSSGKNQNQTSKQGSGGNLSSGRAQTAAKKPANQRTGDAKAGELSKDNTVVLADKRINGIVVMTDKELVPTIEQIIESMDIKLSQVLIETVIIEVTLGDDLQTGIDWVRLGNKTQTGTTPRLGSNGLQMYNYLSSDGKTIKQHENVGESFTTTDSDDNEITWTRIGEGLVDAVYGRNGFWTSGLQGEAMQYMAGGGGGTGTSLLKGLASGLVQEGSNTVSLTPIGSGLNYFFKSDRLNLGAVIQASKTDTRARYLASPIVMTVDNKEATIDATEARKFFNGYETSSSTYNYIRTPKYDSKDIGIKIKVTPKINPNGTVMLNIEEEYSQLGAGQTILVDDGSQAAIDTSLTRKMTADVLLENMETVILCGLTEKYNQDKETGIPILKDIPWIGKWLFGSVSQTESRKELLVFMTPYVMDDSEAAQFEALRRKKTLSDPRAWEDNGWSLSKLADPVSKKEVLRRLEDEAKKQDEERQTKIATEKWKVDRAKKLKQLTKEERDLWLKMHKEELEKEEREALEEKMLDDKSQEELKKLAAEIRAKKLAESEKELKKAADETAAENERAKRDAEKKVEAEGGEKVEAEGGGGERKGNVSSSATGLGSGGASLLGEIEAK